MVEERRRRVNELFHAALEHEPETRLAFLESSCGDDADLRRQVELLLAKQEEAGSFLETPAIDYTAVKRIATGSRGLLATGRLHSRDHRNAVGLQNVLDLICGAEYPIRDFAKQTQAEAED